MGWKRNAKLNLPNGTKIRYLGIEGSVTNYGAPPMDFIRVGMPGATYIAYVHYYDIEVWEEEKPEPPAPQYNATNWYLCPKTGDLFYFSLPEGWYICVNNMKPPLHWDADKDARVKDLKRLYKEA